MAGRYAPKPRPLAQRPTHFQGVRCPRCLAAPGYPCTGSDLERFAHRERKDLARANLEGRP